VQLQNAVIHITGSRPLSEENNHSWNYASAHITQYQILQTNLITHSSLQLLAPKLCPNYASQIYY